MKTFAATSLALLCCCAAANTVSSVDPEPTTPLPALEAPRAATDGKLCTLHRADALGDGAVRIRPGETLCVQLRIVDGRPQPVGLVGAEAGADALVITASLDNGRTTLTLRNPLGQWLRYQAFMRPAADGQLRYTSSCPVMSNHRLAFEDWPYPITEFVLTSFEIEPAPDGADPPRMSCH